MQRNLHCFFRSEGRLIAGTIRFFDLFSGIGGFREGLHRAGGFTCVGHCEADAYADHNYRVLFDTEGEWFCNDARNIETERMPDFDLLCAGFPCQAFSIAGRREGFADARGTLFFEVARLVADKRPAYFLLENVPGLLSHDKGRTFHTILSTLSELGYHVEWKVLNSKDFGVPQSRKRVYIVGYLDGRCAGKILPFPKANGTALIQVHAGKQGERVYAEEGLSCTLTSGSGGMGGKTGLYEVGIPIKENTRKGYKISRYDAAVAIGRMFGTEPYHIRSYDSWCVKDSDGKTWKFSRDSSIDCERLANGTVIDADGDYSTEMVSPKLEYSEMGKLQEVVRCVKNAGAFVNSSCGMHVHVDASNHTPRSLKNALTIMYCKEDILFKALNVQTRREDEYCQKVRPMVLEKIRRMPNSTITMEKFKRAWYEGNDGSSEHYNWTRYYALNLHAVFSKGTLEWRCFESTLHAGKVRSNITLALAISAQAINQSCTHAKKTEIGDNPAFTFRTFLLRLGLIGDEYKNVRKHLLANLDGDKAWRYDKSTYACLQNPRRTDDAR